jgi:hypothetical protein
MVARAAFVRAVLIALTATVVVPAAINTTMLVTTAVLIFVHAIIFNAPLMRVKVEPLAAIPFVIATAVTDFASTAGAA